MPSWHLLGGIVYRTSGRLERSCLGRTGCNCRIKALKNCEYSNDIGRYTLTDPDCATMIQRMQLNAETGKEQGILLQCNVQPKTHLKEVHEQLSNDSGATSCIDT